MGLALACLRLGYKEARLVFVNEKLLFRDRAIYNVVRRVLDQDEARILYTTKFDPAPGEKQASEEEQENSPRKEKTVWIIDECDSIIFEEPTKFRNKLEEMSEDDALICLTATPFKSGTAFGAERTFLSDHNFVCLFYSGTKVSTTLEYDDANLVLDDAEAVKTYVNAQQALHPVLIYAVNEAAEPYAQGTVPVDEDG